VSILTELYRKHLGDIVTLAIGDNPNDIPMLEKVDYPVIVQLPDGSHDQRISLPGLMKAEGIGPAGWNKSVFSYLEKLAF
jgi:mannosyl-3-phosphoglycerate phosphatase